MKQTRVWQSGEWHILPRQRVAGPQSPWTGRSYLSLDFNHDLLCFEEEIHPGTASGITWRPLLGANVVELQLQQGVKQVLNVILVLYD